MSPDTDSPLPFHTDNSLYAFRRKKISDRKLLHRHSLTVFQIYPVISVPYLISGICIGSPFQPFICFSGNIDILSFNILLNHFYYFNWQNLFCFFIAHICLPDVFFRKSNGYFLFYFFAIAIAMQTEPVYSYTTLPFLIFKQIFEFHLPLFVYPMFRFRNECLPFLHQSIHAFFQALLLPEVATCHAYES